MKETKNSARCGTTILCFLAAVIGQVYLLRNVLFTGTLPSPLTPYLAELVFSLMLLGAVVWCFRCPQGWRSRKGSIAAFVLFAVYMAANVLYYGPLSEAYSAGITAEYASTGRALLGLKLVLVFMGIVAGMPASAPIDSREYSRLLREKAELQSAEWAKASVKGSKKELDDTMRRLKETLSPEEMAALAAELQSYTAPAPEAPAAEEKSAAERLHEMNSGC